MEKGTHTFGPFKHTQSELYPHFAEVSPQKCAKRIIPQKFTKYASYHS